MHTMPGKEKETTMEGKKNRVRATSKPTVKLVHSDYQPYKSELQEEIILPGIEGKSLEQVAQKVLRPVNIKWVDKPKTS